MRGLRRRQLLAVDRGKLLFAVGVTGIGGQRRTRPIAIPHLQHGIDPVAVPLRVGERSEGDGRSLGELNLRGRTGASVVALLRGDRRIAFPEASERLTAGDLVAVTGSHDAIAAAAALLGSHGAAAH